jgi:uncharacterized Tic20 family protein
MDEPKPLGPGPEPIPPVTSTPTKDACTFAMLAHLLGAILCFLGPLIIWLVKKDEHVFIDDQGKEALNFHLTLLIVYVALAVLAAVTCGIGAVLYPVVYLVQIIMGILAAVKANGGEYYRYPFNIRMVK